MAGRHSKTGFQMPRISLSGVFGKPKPGRHAIANPKRTTVRGSSSGIQGRGRTEFIGGANRSAPLFGTRDQMARRGRTGNPLGFGGVKQGRPGSHAFSSYWR
jgi:hypothetical protein